MTKGSILILEMIPINSFTQIEALTALMMTPRAMSLHGKAFGSFISLMLSSPPARMMTGIESKNEKFALPL